VHAEVLLHDWLGMQPSHVSPWQVSPAPHGLHDSTRPHPRLTSAQPVAPTCAQVIGVQHELPWHTSPAPHGAHSSDTPQPKSVEPQPVTMPIDCAWLQVSGVQQLPLKHSAPPLHVPHEMDPHPFAT
jgi:hypothetical protein